MVPLARAALARVVWLPPESTVASGTAPWSFTYFWIIWPTGCTDPAKMTPSRSKHDSLATRMASGGMSS